MFLLKNPYLNYSDSPSNLPTVLSILSAVLPHFVSVMLPALYLAVDTMAPFL